MNIHQATKRAQKHNSVQKKIIIHYMLMHPEFAAGRFIGLRGKEKSEQLWDELSNQLNCQGTEKTKNQWQKVWKDMKARVKTKAVNIKTARLRTGNFPAENSLLTEEELGILGLMGSAAVEGCMVPDSMPEGMFAIDELRRADESVLEETPTQICMFNHFDISTPEKTIDMEIETGDVISARIPEMGQSVIIAQSGKSADNLLPDDLATSNEKIISSGNASRPSFRLRQKRTRPNNETINRILSMQEKQNAILEKMAEAMMMSSKNEEKRLKLEEEKLVVKRQTCQALNAIADAMAGHS